MATIPIAVLVLALGLGACSYEVGSDTLTGDVAVGPHPLPPAGEGEVFSILPFAGTPVTIADSIYREMRDKAAKANVKLVLRLDQPATWRVRPYLAAVGTDTSTAIVYRVDIFDHRGQRVHRFFGQETAPSATGDSWTGIDDKAEKALADDILQGIRAWATRPGA